MTHEALRGFSVVRVALVAAATMSISLVACSAPPREPGRFEARVDIDNAHPLKAVNPRILGTNVQWVDRGDELLEPDGRAFSAPMLKAVVELGPTVIRYPGGSMSDTFHWRDGVGAPEERKLNEHFFSAKQQAVAFGTREFLELCEAAGADPLITVNTASGTPAEAAAWVDYTNRQTLTSRRTSKPLSRVQYWEIGNEPYLRDDKRKALWITPEAFADRANAFIRAMKAVDPTIKVGIPLRSDEIGGRPATPIPGYNAKVLPRISAPLDFVALHDAYLPLAFDKSYSDEELYWATMASVSVVADDFEHTRRQLRDLRNGPGVPIAVTEYQALYSLGKSTDRYITTPASAVYVADLLRMFAQTDDLLFANFWSLSGNWFFGAISNSGELRPSYHVLRMYREAMQGRMLATTITSPQFSTTAVGYVPARTGLPLLTGMSTTTGKVTRAVLINKSLTDIAATRIEVTGRSITHVGYTSLGGTSPFEEQGTPADGVIRRGDPAPTGTGVTLELPPFSVTLVTLSLGDSQ